MVKVLSGLASHCDLGSQTSRCPSKISHALSVSRRTSAAISTRSDLRTSRSSRKPRLMAHPPLDWAPETDFVDRSGRAFGQETGRSINCVIPLHECVGVELGAHVLYRVLKGGRRDDELSQHRLQLPGPLRRCNKPFSVVHKGYDQGGVGGPAHTCDQPVS